MTRMQKKATSGSTPTNMVDAAPVNADIRANDSGYNRPTWFGYSRISTPGHFAQSRDDVAAGRSLGGVLGSNCLDAKTGMRVVSCLADVALYLQKMRNCFGFLI